MRQIFTRIALVFIIALAFVGFTFNFSGASVNDFKFTSFDADYYLSKDSEGHSSLKVVERLTAEFNNYNQNKGIERAIPKNYDGHSTSFKLLSLTRNGQTEPVYEQRDESNFVVVATGTDDYVNGSQQYVFTYTLRDVIKNFGDHQELYWDTNGTGWSQQFDNLTVRVHLDDSVKNGFTGAVSCYKGVQGSKDKCGYTTDGGVVSLNSGGLLGAGENLTLDLSFRSGTFIGYQITIQDMIPYALIILAVLLLMVMIIIKLRYGRNNPGRGTIIPEYLPPNGVSVLAAAEITGKPTSSMTAQIIDLAVRHKIKIIESKEKVLFMNTTEYTLELVSVDGLSQDELIFVDIMFGSNQIGNRYTFSRNDSTKARLFYTLNKSIKKESVDQGFRLKLATQNIIQKCISSLLAILIFIGVFFVDGASSDVILISIATYAVVFIIIGAFKLQTLKPFTLKGRELYDYLKGLESYIKLAEADRLKVLQSPEGADRKPINTDDGSEMIILYERVLPYAVLFGQEKEWLKQLGNYYETNQTSPLWYSGINGFNAAAFASSVSGFSSYANSSSYSSSSGAGGGGSSGGGGGGGGGGGR